MASAVIAAAEAVAAAGSAAVVALVSAPNVAASVPQAAASVPRAAANVLTEDLAQSVVTATTVVSVPTAANRAVVAIRVRRSSS